MGAGRVGTQAGEGRGLMGQSGGSGHHPHRQRGSGSQQPRLPGERPMVQARKASRLRVFQSEQKEEENDESCV